MGRVKKIHNIIIFFILIFLLGVYSFTLYINNTIDKKNENIEESDVHASGKFDREATKIN
ncbi:hypothetical protein [Aquimarina mytili]|uniref:hypothetical protein n=1 Tax=Aquimarina mytili TaxID=874423 RepID=UPI00191CA9BD|nr:hypothetical protein [Aquimarina mytili]